MLEVDQESIEHVLVETIAGEKWHERWIGFGNAMGQARPLLIPCNGWRTSSLENWTYLAQGEFIAGAQTEQGVIAYLENNRSIVVTR